MKLLENVDTYVGIAEISRFDLKNELFRLFLMNSSFGLNGFGENNIRERGRESEKTPKMSEISIYRIQ